MYIYENMSFTKVVHFYLGQAIAIGETVPEISTEPQQQVCK